MATLILIVVCSCKKENQRGGSPSPSENIIGKWQFVGNDPNTWYWYFREDLTHFSPARLATDNGYHYEINDSVFIIYDTNNHEQLRYNYECFGDSLITGRQAYTTVITPNGTTTYVPYYQEFHFFRYTGR